MNECLNCGKPVKNKFCNVSCQNTYQGSLRANNRYGEFKLFTVECKKCGKSFEVNEREKLFPQKNKYFCSLSCSNSRNWNKEDKEKKRDSYFKNPNNKKKKEFENICKNCDKTFKSFRVKRSFCSLSCVTVYYNNNTNRCQRAGLNSAKVQSESRRSKNEIYFAELCEKEFNVVLTNQPIFNGWDADVIIEDFKIAVLWNGKWHYEKLTKQHSVKQVQNRDKIKINEIKKMKYEPYIIKDLGKYNKNFVEEEFEKLKRYIAD